MVFEKSGEQFCTTAIVGEMGSMAGAGNGSVTSDDTSSTIDVSSTEDSWSMWGRIKADSMASSDLTLREKLFNEALTDFTKQVECQLLMLVLRGYSTRQLRVEGPVPQWEGSTFYLTGKIYSVGGPMIAQLVKESYAK